MLVFLGAAAHTNAQNRRHARTQSLPSKSRAKQSADASSVSVKPKAEIQMSALCGKAISFPQPIYPQEARAAKASGLVTVNVVADETGKVIWAKAVNGNLLLRDAAVKAAYLAQYTPTRIADRAVKMETEITYHFVSQ